MITIKKGLDLPIAGSPVQELRPGNSVQSVAIVGSDYVGMKPTMEVRVGDSVKLGQLLFTDKKTPGVRYTSPGTGKLVAINRGEKRVLQSVVISLEGEGEETFQSYSGKELDTLNREQVENNLVSSGLWTSFRTRPFSRVPAPGSTPNSIFVTAMDTNPLAANPGILLREETESFTNGLIVLRKLIEGKVFLCKSPDSVIHGTILDGIQIEEFSGPHPAGLAGTHIHFLDPVHIEKTVWSINYQDVIASLPIILVFLIFQKQIISGLTKGAVKG